MNGLIFQGDAHAAAASKDFQAWRKAMADKGWGTPTWDKAYGGAGLSPAQAKIIAQELSAIGAFNPIRSYGTMMLGPTLLEFGTEEQRLQHLPRISTHELRWCQGFSEPGAGSDLASLQMKCVDAGDHWVVSGQKIWTSGADQADWCFALVRTDTSVKHGGISFLLIDMKSPGVEARPIVLISGSTHFCEVFFNDVKVPKGNLVGAVNQGWNIAKRLLQFERSSLSEVKTDVTPLAPIAHAMLGTDEEGRIADVDARARIVHNAMRHTAYLQTVRRFNEEARNGGPGNGVSTLKNLWSGIVQRRAELLVEVLGADGLGWSGDAYPADAREATRALLHSKAFSIYGGSYEIQNNITAKRSLGLPDR
ncbi:alkylation response protein AidB-like acyl-CoA dehydrogenase [Novosphingobium sp. SG707]|nr:alkylation response protein AidB-like acyl-CoA dehydrogenase [Novosphingobium sp. SG707]